MITATDVRGILSGSGESSRTIDLGVEAPGPIIALGAELKATLCCWTGREAVFSPVRDDLRDGQAYRAYRHALTELAEAFEPDEPMIAHDLHPRYVSAELAAPLNLPTEGVQHHHAHAAAALGQPAPDRRYLAIVCDGTGYGLDGASWGGEVLLCTATQFERIAHLRYCPLAGGDASSIQTWRPAAALLREAFGDKWHDLDLPLIAGLDRYRISLVDRMLAREVNCPRSSSLGRIFDAVAAITGLCLNNTQPAEAAIAVQSAAQQYRETYGDAIEPYPVELASDGAPQQIDLRPMIRCMVDDVRTGIDASQMAARFHETVCRAFARVAASAAHQHDVDTVVMSGGCFLNAILSERLSMLLCSAGLEPRLPRAVSVGDDGISLGQALVAGARMWRENPCV